METSIYPQPRAHGTQQLLSGAEDRKQPPRWGESRCPKNYSSCFLGSDLLSQALVWRQLQPHFTNEGRTLGHSSEPQPGDLRPAEPALPTDPSVQRPGYEVWYSRASQEGHWWSSGGAASLACAVQLGSPQVGKGSSGPSVSCAGELVAGQVAGSPGVHQASNHSLKFHPSLEADLS